jgi:hypothetical protein
MMTGKVITAEKVMSSGTVMSARVVLMTGTARIEVHSETETQE